MKNWLDIFDEWIYRKPIEFAAACTLATALVIILSACALKACELADMRRTEEMYLRYIERTEADFAASARRMADEEKD